MSATGTRAIASLRRAGIDFAIHPYEAPERHGAAREDRPTYGLDAATALGVEPGLLLKTLVVMADADPLLAMLPVDRTLDPKRCAAAVGAHRAVLATTADAERLTGYRVGGISPLGTQRRFRTLLDASVMGLERVYLSAGRRGLQVSLRRADLILATGADVADLAVSTARYVDDTTKNENDY